MRIAAYVEHAYGAAGGNRVYETELIRHLGRVDDRNEYTLFTSKTYAGLPDLDVGGNPRFHRRSLSLSHGMCRALWLMADWPPVNASIGDHDVYHSMNPIVFPARGGKYLVTIHDLFTLVIPELVDRRHRFVWNVHVKRMLKRADHFVAVSAWTKRDMVERLLVPPEKITVVHEGVRPGFGVLERSAVDEIRRKHGLAHPYFIMGESRNPRKNVLRMIRAFGRVGRRREEPVTLAVTSAGGAFSQEVQNEIAREGLGDAVKFLPRVSDADLVALMNGAVALLFVSLYEGFGLPILEAMACDTPVVTSTVSSMPEVAGDAGLLVDPTDEGAIAEAMWRILSDDETRRRLVDAGRNRVKQFSWERTAQEYLKVYESLA